MDNIDFNENCNSYNQETFNNESVNRDGLFVMNFNIRSLYKNGCCFSAYIDGLNKKPDVVVLSETWLKDGSYDDLPGYKAFNSVRTEKLGGGLSIFCRNNLDYKILEVSNSNTEVMEYVHVQLHNANKKPINIVGIYRAPGHGV